MRKLNVVYSCSYLVCGILVFIYSCVCVCVCVCVYVCVCVCVCVVSVCVAGVVDEDALRKNSRQVLTKERAGDSGCSVNVPKIE